jgi:hypothetical protein
MSGFWTALVHHHNDGTRAQVSVAVCPGCGCLVTSCPECAEMDVRGNEHVSEYCRDTRCACHHGGRVLEASETAVLASQAAHLGGEYDVATGWQLMEGEAA